MRPSVATLEALVKGFDENTGFLRGPSPEHAGGASASSAHAPVFSDGALASPKVSAKDKKAKNEKKDEKQKKEKKSTDASKGSGLKIKKATLKKK